MSCVAFLQWALPRMRMRWRGFRKVRGQVCKRLGRRVRDLGLDDLEAYRALLEAEPSEWTVLDEMCRITISRFRRDRGVWVHLEQRTLPSLAGRAARQLRPIRAWVAGCASGEEAYSLRLVWPNERDPPLTILATDADSHMIERARSARYSAATLRELGAEQIEASFEPCGTLHQVRDRVRRGIELATQDLRCQMPAGPFDIILCRNLALTYFDDSLQVEVVTRLVERLVPGGALVIGAHESLPPGRFALEPACSCVFRRMGS